jgi:hypothetical protein
MSKTRFPIQGQAHKAKQVVSFLKIHQKVYTAAETLLPSDPGPKEANFFTRKRVASSGLSSWIFSKMAWVPKVLCMIINVPGSSLPLHRLMGFP